MQIRVHVIDRSRNRNLSMVYRCPRTRKKVERSTGTTNQRDAERAAARWEDELNSATPSGDGSLAWGHFCDLLDERRSFGVRWSRKVMPQVLQLLMRHSSITTTMKYYVGQDVTHADEVLWMGGKIGGSGADDKNEASRKPL